MQALLPRLSSDPSQALCCNAQTLHYSCLHAALARPCCNFRGQLTQPNVSVHACCLKATQGKPQIGLDWPLLVMRESNPMLHCLALCLTAVWYRHELRPLTAVRRSDLGTSRQTHFLVIQGITRCNRPHSRREQVMPCHVMSCHAAELSHATACCCAEQVMSCFAVLSK